MSGSLKYPQFIHYDSSEIDHFNSNLYQGFGYPPKGPSNHMDVSLYHGFRYPPNGSYNSYIHNHQYFNTFPTAQNSEALPPSIWAHPCIQQVPSPPCMNPKIGLQENYSSYTFGGRNGTQSKLITYYAPYRRMRIHFPRVPRDGDIFCYRRGYNVLILDIVSKDTIWELRRLHYSGYPNNWDLYRVYEATGGVLLMRTGVELLASPEKNRTSTNYHPKFDIVSHYTTVPKHGQIFSAKQIDNVIILDVIPMENSRESLCLNRGLYRAHLVEDIIVLQRMSDEILVFHEEKSIATYYLPDKDIALHFTKDPRDGDLFCSQRNGNVVILNPLPAATSQERHDITNFFYPWDRDLYRVQEGNGRFLLVKMDKNNMPIEESYTFSETIPAQENITFTCYLQHKNMAFHFNRIPTHGDYFLSQLKNNIMLLEVCPKHADDHPNCSYGSPLDIDVYHVQQRDDGFELLQISMNEVTISPEYKLRLHLKIRRYIASSPIRDEDVCAVCLDAYKNFDRIGSIHCGHEYHVGCIVKWLRKSGLCPLCRGKAVPPRRTKYLCLASASPSPSSQTS